MPALNYLELDINKLFEGHTIKEIEQIQKKIQNESERKKVELRTLVGERYRDLIQAADTIAEMKQTSEDVIARIADMEETCRELRQKYLIGFRMEPVEKKPDEEYERVSDSVVIRIKILMDIPEHIWTAIDSNDFFNAAQSFVLVQHINYSLKLEIGSDELSSKYPIVAKQWGVISQFRDVISSGCNDVLQSLDLSVESTANCLAASVLLDGTSSMDLLTKLISLRCRAVKSIIEDESGHGVKRKIKLCVEALTQTITLIYFCFFEANNRKDGLISQYVKSIADVEASSMLLQFDLDKDLVNKYLPAVLMNYKPFARGDMDALPLTALRDNVQSWLSWVKEFTSSEITKLLNLVTSVKGIYNIREEALALSLPENWKAVWEKLSLPDTNFWSEFFQPLLTERVKGIMRCKWDEALTNLNTSIGDLLGRVTHEKYDFPEHDLRWYVWKDSPNDIPQKLTKNGASDNRRPLLMKTRGYSPNVVKLCEDFDKNLFALLLDLEQYLYDTDRVTLVKDDLLAINISSVSNKFADRAAIQEELRNISSSKLNELTEFVREECVADEPKFGRQDINAIAMARFFQAMTMLCPNLNKCFTLSKAVSGLTIANATWQSVCDGLREESTLAWLSWANLYKSKICEYRDIYLRKESITGSWIRSIVSEWEKVTIEEEAEVGKRIKSEILVPYQPSVNLQKFLASVSKDLNAVIPHTIPKKVLSEIADAMATGLFDYYEEISNNEKLRQKQALQILLDLKYITLLMIPRENKILVEKSVEICDNVLSVIDPFDLDVFYPFIHANVKKSVQRSLLIYGSLVSHAEQLHSVLGARTEYNTGDGGKHVTDPPGILTLCTGAPWFPSLAVTAPTRNLPLAPIAIPDKAQRKKASSKTHARNDSTGATIKSGAAAFFGAMGSDWFGTS